MDKKNRVVVYNYMDYRKFLKEYYAWQKEHTQYFSYRYFSNKAGFASHNVLKQVIAGDRNIARKSISKFCNALNLSPRECEYFALLVLFNQSKSIDEKNDIFKEMLRYKQGSKAKRVNELQYKFYSQWYNTVVRELVAFDDIAPNPADIAECITPEVTAFQVKKSLQILEEIGLIYKNDKNRWEQKDATIKTDDEVESLAIKNYNLKMVELGLESVERVEAKDREVSSLTLGISKEMYKKLKKKIQSFKEEILYDVLSDSTKSEDVYQFNVQFFPLTKKKQG